MSMNSFWLLLGLYVLIYTCDCVRRHLNPPEVARAVQMIQDGHSQRNVARTLDVSQSVIARLWARYQETGQYTRRPGQGRSRCTTNADDRYIRLMALRNRRGTATRLQIQFQLTTGQRVSTQTIRNRLHNDTMNARRPATGPVLTRAHRIRRREFSEDHLNWGLRDWEPVLFTDESRFHLSSCDRRTRVWRRPGERYADFNIMEWDRFGGGSVMVWGGICLRGRTDLYVFDRGTLTALRYRDDILAPIVRPFAGAIGVDFILMQDNARPHTARIAMDYLNQEGIEVMDWPARSPDLNPIEHVWDYIYRRISERDNRPLTLPDLIQALILEWNGLPQQVIATLIRSVPRRCRECYNRRGGHTHY